MATKIEWTNETWNPVTGCTKVSEGCRNCYAERMSKRLAGRFGYPEAPNSFDVTLCKDRLPIPLHWDKPRMVFVCSMGDLFHPEVPFEFIDRVFAIIQRCPQHTFQILTKRPERMKEYIDSRIDNIKQGRRGFWPVCPWPIFWLWLGVSAEDQAAADERIPVLLDTPAAVRFVSIEPILGPVRLREPDFSDRGYGPGWLISGNAANSPALDWVIVGGESGPGARAPDPDWIRDIRDQCVAADVPFFFKQWGGPQKKGWVIEGKVYSGRELDGETWDQFPGQRSE